MPTLARMIVREHLYKPITGRVLCLGRQTIGITYEQFVELLKQENYLVSNDVLDSTKSEHDNQTRVGKKNSDFISDKVFFDLLGIKQVRSMDVSTYEKADIIHDLNKPIPKNLEGQFDFIIDGGTFDHLFDLRTAFENVVKMLKVGGKVFQWNAASNFAGDTYLSFGPDFFYDYYVLNKFADCKVYLAEVDVRGGQKEQWDIYEFVGTKYRYFYSKRVVMVIVLAEKGPSSTYSRMPVQLQYRDAHLKQEYEDNQKIISLSARRSYRGSARTKIKALANKIRNRIVREIGYLGTSEEKVIQGYRYVGKI